MGKVAAYDRSGGAGRFAGRLLPEDSDLRKLKHNSLLPKEPQGATKTLDPWLGIERNM